MFDNFSLDNIDMTKAKIIKQLPHTKLDQETKIVCEKKENIVSI